MPEQKHQSPNSVFSQILFRDFYLKNSVEFYKSEEDVKAILDDLWNKNSGKSPEDFQKIDWKLFGYNFNEKDELPYFNDGVIVLIKLPEPVNSGDSYFISVGVVTKLAGQSTISPFYWLLECGSKTFF